jgi:hypothetical protein
MPLENLCLANQEHSAQLVKSSSTEKELHFEIDFKMPTTASFNEVIAKTGEFLQSYSVKKTLDTLKGRIINFRILHQTGIKIRSETL